MGSWQIIIGNLITTCVGVWLTNKYLYERYVIKKERRDYLKKSLSLVYLPIRKIIDRSIFPSESYEGLNSTDVNKIIDIIEQNILYADDALDKWYWSLQEDLYYNSMNLDRFDTNGEFCTYIERQYKSLRQQLFDA